MSEIKKISVDGVVYNIAASSENPSEDIQKQIDDLNVKTDELDKKISDEASRVDGMINQVNENTAASIQTLNDNLVQAINTINGGVSAEVISREEGDKILQENIDAEAVAREEKDNSLEESINTIQEKVDSIEDPSELVEAEKAEREAADSELSEKLDSSVKTLNETIATVNENTAASIQTLNDNLVQAINTINGGIDNEIRPELEKSVKYQEFEYNGETRKTIQLNNYDSISGLDTEGNGYNLAMVSKWDKADFGSANIQMNLNSSGRVTVNDTEEIAYLSDVATDQDFEALKTQVEENTSKIEEVNTTLVDAIGSLNESINTKTEDINTRIDTEVLQKINELDKNKVGLVETDKNGIKTLNIVLENYASLLGKDTQGALYNLAMVSKWDKADFGSASIELNFNGSKERPTYNDEVELALLTDITGNLNEVNLVKKSDLEYELQVGDRIAGTINIPEDQFFKGSSYNEETHVLTLTFKTEKGDQSQDIDLSNLVDIYTAGNGIALEGGSFSVKLDPSTDAYLEVDENGLRLVGLKDELDSKASVEELSAETEARTFADTQLQEDLQAEGEARIAADEEINTELQKKVDYTDISDSDNPERKTIQLKNHDSISGLNTDGTGFNIAMVSKWNKVDLGSSGIELNLNGSAEHPTYNDSEEIAFIKDLEDINEDIEVDIPIRTLKDEVYDKATIFGWFGVEDEVELKQLIAYKGQMYIKWGISLSTNPHYYRMPIQYAAFESATQLKLVVLGLDTSNDAPVKYEVILNLDGTIAEGNSNIKVAITNIATESWVNSQGYLTEHQDISGLATKSELQKVANSKLYYPGVKVDTQKLFSLTKESSEDDIKAALQIEVASGGYTLPTAEILDECLGKGYQLLSNWMPVSIVWNGAAYVFYIVGQNYMMKPTGLYTVAIRIVDGTYSVFQAAKVEEFANTDELSTINEKINSINSSITVLSDKLSLLQAKYDSIVAENSEEVIDFQGGNEDINDNSKSFILNNSQITSSTTMNAKSIVINEANLSNDARMKINSGNVEINNLSVSGNFPKANGNAVINVNESEYIVFKDMIFDSSDIYNGIEIGLNSTTLPKNILFENCKFTGAFSNNAILIFGTQNNATITLSNCYFEKVSNALRLSNKTNASGITVNIVNCTVDAWDTLAPWQGFLICQDYTSGSSEEVDTNNLFGNNKITVNFTNLVHNGEKIIPDNLQKVCGTGNDDQIVYIYAEQKDPSNAIPYSENIYPIINFN